MTKFAIILDNYSPGGRGAVASATQYAIIDRKMGISIVGSGSTATGQAHGWPNKFQSGEEILKNASITPEILAKASDEAIVLLIRYGYFEEKYYEFEGVKYTLKFNGSDIGTYKNGVKIPNSIYRGKDGVHYINGDVRYKIPLLNIGAGNSSIFFKEQPKFLFHFPS